jgi:hypothetical protein
MEYYALLKEDFYARLRTSNAAGTCTTYEVKKVLAHLFCLHSARANGTSNYTNLAIDLQAALHADDYLTVLLIMNHFGNAMGFPYCNPALEYTVTFQHDPHHDMYAEIMANMHVNPALMPTFDMADDLTPNGPVIRHPGRMRRMEQAVAALRTKRPRVDHRNQRERAFAPGTNPVYVPPPAPPPPVLHPDEVSDDELMAHMGANAFREPDADEWQAAFEDPEW